MSTLFNLKVQTSYKLAHRYRKGHNVQSPFLYRYFREVLYNNCKDSFLEEMKRKYKLYYNDSNEIIFKTTIFLDAKKITEINTKNKLTSLYLINENKNIVITEHSQDPETIDFFNKIQKDNSYNIQLVQDDILKRNYESENIVIINSFNKSDITLKYLNKIQETTNSQSVIIITGINENKETQKIIEIVKTLKKVTAIVDNYNCVILFNKPDLERRYYKINKL